MTAAKFTMADFATMPERVRGGERTERLTRAARAMNYQIPYLDDVLRGILPNDLIMISAETGVGKTELAMSILLANAHKEIRGAYLALEAEPLELERRAKYAWLVREAFRPSRGITVTGTVSYTDWLLGRCEDSLGLLDEEADRWIAGHLETLRTFYRGKHFGAADLKAAIEAVAASVDIIVVDHLHYVDSDREDDESRALGEVVKVLRELALHVGKPIIVVAHLRKKDQRAVKLVPDVHDFHGSSNITKIATQLIVVARAPYKSKWYFSPTFMHVVKDRRDGSLPFVALMQFDRRTRMYTDEYTLGRLTKHGSQWEQLSLTERPGWARGHKQLQMELEQ